MHDMIITNQIINKIENKDNVISISLELGDLAGISPHHLEETIKKLTGWSIEINIKKSRVRCSCGFEGEAKIKQRLHDFVIFECPNCSNTPEVLEGKDIKIIKILYK